MSGSGLVFVVVSSKNKLLLWLTFVFYFFSVHGVAVMHRRRCCSHCSFVASYAHQYPCFSTPAKRPVTPLP